MTPLQAAILGIVEGVTEYLPISSTGHLILAGRALGLGGEGTKTFEIVIQFGAILAVVVHYRRLLRTRFVELVMGRRQAVNLAAAILVAFLPAALLGLVLHKTIKHHLFGPVSVAGALVVGGIAMIAVERIRKRQGVRGEDGLEKVSFARAFWIGLGQCLSLWPGASRSMCTIVAGQLTGLTTATAADFSFLLALPTLGAATAYDFYKGRALLLSAEGGWGSLAVGMTVAFVVAWGVIATFLRYLQRHGLEPFGYYRIAVGALVFWVMSG